MEQSQDRTESSKKWSGGRRRGRRQRIGPTQMKKIRKLGGGERERSILRNPSGETGEWTPQEFGMRGRGVMRPHE